MADFVFECGCRWPVVGDPPRDGALPLMDVDLDKLPLDCKQTWKMLGDGKTKGVFQLESQLGRCWCMKLKPENAEHIGALGSILRPGCLRSIDEDGVSATEHYCRRKNGQEAVEPVHPVVDSILEPTYGQMIFQEGAMQIARAVANFSLQDADTLRKSIGKKLPEEMAKCEKMFMEGAEKAGIIPMDLARQLFSYIKESQRYSFNKSHAISYGLIGYDSAYLKAHWPAACFTAWIHHAREKSDPLTEIAELVDEAKLFDVPVEPPDILAPNSRYATDGVTITCGVCDVKGIGDSFKTKLDQAVGVAREVLNSPPETWNWPQALVHAYSQLPAAAVEKLIKVGGFRRYGVSRRSLAYQFGAFSTLTKKEVDWLRKRTLPADVEVADLLEELAKPKKEGGGVSSVKRGASVAAQATLLRNPPVSLRDPPLEIASNEEELLGCSLTCSRIDACDASDANCTAKEYLGGRKGTVLMAVEVRDAREAIIKSGNNQGRTMAYLSLADSTATITDARAFADSWAKHKGILTKGATVMIWGERDKKGGTLFVNRAFPLAQQTTF